MASAIPCCSERIARTHGGPEACLIELVGKNIALTECETHIHVEFEPSKAVGKTQSEAEAHSVLETGRTERCHEDQRTNQFEKTESRYYPSLY